MKKMIALLLTFVLCLSLCACSDKSNAVVTTEKTYTVEIDGQVYHANSQEEIDKIINDHIYGDLNAILDSGNSDGYIDTDKTGKAMIDVESGKYLGITSGDFTEFYFKVRNVSDVAVHTIGIDIDILDESGDIVDTTHPQEASTLQPGQALVIDAIIKNDRGGVAAIVSSYSLYTIDGEYAHGRVDNSAKVEFVDIAIEPTEKKAETYNYPKPATSDKQKETCIECGASATYTYKNPFSGKMENYCYTHYQEIIDIMSMMEADVGSSKQTKHTCEQCSREGTHRYDSFTGQTEYYCTQHYEELMDMLEAFGIE